MTICVIQIFKYELGFIADNLSEIHIGQYENVMIQTLTSAGIKNLQEYSDF